MQPLTRHRTAPPATFERFDAELTLTVPAVPAEVARIRHAVERLAMAAGMDEARRADVALAVGEACANAVMHAFEGTAAGTLRLWAGTRCGRLDVAIADDGCGMVPRPTISPGLGLGLDLIASLSTSSEVRPAPGGGTEVRMGFALEDEPAGPAYRTGRFRRTA